MSCDTVYITSGTYPSTERQQTISVIHVYHNKTDIRGSQFVLYTCYVIIMSGLECHLCNDINSKYIRIYTCHMKTTTLTGRNASLTWRNASLTWCLFVCLSLTSLCHCIETMPAREINPFTALTRIRSQFLRTKWSTSNHQRVDTATPQTAQPSGLAIHWRDVMPN